MALTLDLINQVCLDLGGTGGHKMNIDALNEVCTLLGGTGGHAMNIDALNEIQGSVTYKQEIDALNAIITDKGGTAGTHKMSYDAWQAIQQGSLLNLFDALAPSGLTATVASDTVINLAFTVNSTNGDGTRIYISTDGVNFTEKGTVSGSTATYSATGLTANTLYYFKVVAYRGGTESDASNTASATTMLSLTNNIQYFDGTVSGGELVDKSSSPLNAILTLNAIRNGNCEGDWGFTKYNGTSQTLERSSEQAHGGTYSLKFVTASANLGFNTATFYTKSGETYNYGFWVYKGQNDASQISLRIYNGAGTMVANKYAQTGTYGAWVYISGSYTENATGYGAYFNFYSPSNSCTFYVDDIIRENQNTSDLYIRLQSNAGIISADVDNKFFDTSGNPYTLNLSVTEPYYNSNLFYDLPNKKLILYTNSVFGNNFINAHDYINWNPITSIAQVKTVKKDGTGDYTTIQAAINAVTGTALSKWRIDIYDDWTITDKADYQTDGGYKHFLILKNYVFLNGVGTSKIKITCSIPDGSSYAEMSTYEPFNISMVSGINNLDVSMRNGRYGVHADTSPLMYIYNSSITRNGGSEFYGSALGLGTANGSYGWLYNTSLIGVGARAFLTRDKYQFTKKSIVGLTKVNIYSTDTISSLIEPCGNLALRNELHINKCNLSGTMNYDGFVLYNGAASTIYYLLDSYLILGANNTIGTFSNTYTEGGSLRITSNNTGGSVHITGGTGQSVLIPTPDETSNHSTGQLEVGEWAFNANLKLAARLGDCSSVNKTLTLTVDGGAEQTITFNQNFTAQTNAQVLTFINAALTGATASLYQRAKDYTPTGL